MLLKGSVFDLTFAPPGQPKANGTGVLPALIEGTILLPALVGLRSRSWLATLYWDRGLSAREISRVAGASRSGVLKALDRFTIPPHIDGHQRTGPLPFGFDYQDHKLVGNSAEQGAIRMMREHRVSGLSLRECWCRPSKAAWQANTVRGILVRA